MSKNEKTKTPRQNKRPGARRTSRKKSSKAKSPRPGPAGWTVGEAKWDQVAAAEGFEPLGTLEEIARGTPEDAEELLDAIRRSRELDLAAQRRSKTD